MIKGILKDKYINLCIYKIVKKYIIIINFLKQPIYI